MEAATTEKTAVELARSLFVRWRNFRGFADTGWIELAPITTVIGPNNSGKTSLHAPLLLLKQSLDQSMSESPLSLRGDLINLGRFEDFIRGHDPARTLSLGLRWIDPSRYPKPDPATLGRDAPGTLTVEFKLENNILVLSRYVVEDVHGRLMLDRVRQDDGSYSLKGLGWVRPDDLDEPSNGLDAAFQKAIAKDRPENFLFSGDTVIGDAVHNMSPSGHDEESEGDETLTPQIPQVAFAYLQVIGYVQGRVSRVLSELDYLGPLREAPKRSYDLPSVPVRAVGSRGQRTAEVFCTGTPDSQRRINKWLDTIDPTLQVRCDELVPGTVRLSITSRYGPPTNIADVGFGVGQVLPIAVAGLTETPDDHSPGTLIMEQPEIHLNPRVQTRLADLVTLVAKRGKRVYVETHSEHFLMRLRTLVAQGFSSDAIALYFVERDRRGSHVKRIPVNHLGHIESADWPSGFFDEGLRAALDLVNTQRERVSAELTN